MKMFAPETTAELAETLRSLNEAGTPVRVIGSGTKLGWGREVAADGAVSVEGLNQFREHVWQDMTCTVDAGMPWAAMQERLAQHGQRVALDPLFADRATVGGVVATNDSGALRMKYGSLRDLVIGMTVVLPDGTVAKSGGKVVKNVAGYDLPKLMIGAFGTLGVITEVTFRLHAIPRHVRHFSVTGRPAELQKLLLKLAASQFSLEALQMRGGGEGFALDVALAAMPEVLVQQGDALRELSESYECACSDAPAEVWNERERLFRDAARTVVKIGALPTQILIAGLRLSELGGTFVAQSTGLVSAALPGDADVAALRAKTEAEGCSLVVLQGPEVKRAERWGAAPDSLALQQMIKAQFDPKHILNPGIFLDGI